MTILTGGQAPQNSLVLRHILQIHFLLMSLQTRLTGNKNHQELCTTTSNILHDDPNWWSSTAKLSCTQTHLTDSFSSDVSPDKVNWEQKQFHLWTFIWNPNVLFIPTLKNSECPACTSSISIWCCAEEFPHCKFNVLVAGEFCGWITTHYPWKHDKPATKKCYLKKKEGKKETSLLEIGANIMPYWFIKLLTDFILFKGHTVC